MFQYLTEDEQKISEQKNGLYSRLSYDYINCTESTIDDFIFLIALL